LRGQPASLRNATFKIYELDKTKGNGRAPFRP
jgi:hypothetical protein